MAVADEVKQAYASLLQSCNTLQLATLSPDNQPEASYAPYTYVDGHYYIFVSELASHTQNILHDPNVSLMLIESEADARNPFARKRFSAQCLATEISREADSYVPLLDQLEQRFGSTIGMLRTLPDFHLFELQAQQGRLVVGFGKAFELDVEQLAQLANS
jgi:putative heme iron utilization protein